MKIIRIKTCEDCPSIGRTDWDHDPKNIPHCMVKRKNLPYTTQNSFAVYTGVIPDWCELEDE